MLQMSQGLKKEKDVENFAKTYKMLQMLQNLQNVANVAELSKCCKKFSVLSCCKYCRDFKKRCKCYRTFNFAD